MHLPLGGIAANMLFAPLIRAMLDCVACYKFTYVCMYKNTKLYGDEMVPLDRALLSPAPADSKQHHFFFI